MYDIELYNLSCYHIGAQDKGYKISFNMMICNYYLWKS